MPKAVILTALEVEYLSVRAHLIDVYEEIHPSGTIYERGKFDANGKDWDVALVQIGQGNPRAAAEAERIISFYSPNTALFVGVAGGIKDVALGDVVAATKIYAYEFGKSVEHFRPRPEVGRSTYRLEQRARAVARSRSWQSRIIHQESERSPKAFVAPIAAGSQVVASTRSGVYALLRESYSDAIAVEMEGHGFLEATHANPQVDALVVRGISDLIEDKGESDAAGWQEIASSNAAAFAFEVLAQIDYGIEGTNSESAVSSTGTFPAIWNVPHVRNPNFTGREEELNTLHERLMTGSSVTITQAQSITGLGGIGKTQIAVEYAYRHRDEYDVIWWLRCEEPVSLANDYIEFTRQANIENMDNLEQSIVVDAVRRWFEHCDYRWLLIFDNAETLESISLYLPRTGKGRSIVTSRNPVWSRRAGPIQLQPLSRPEAIAFLVQRRGSSSQMSPEEFTAIGNLADELGGLPLALEQAAAFAEETGISLRSYADLFHSRGAELLAEGAPLVEDYPATVLTTWELAFGRLEAENPASSSLLKLGSYFGPDNIPRELISRHAHVLPTLLKDVASDPLTFARAIGALRRFSLIDVIDDDSFTIHRMVQAVTRARVTADELTVWITAALGIVEEAFPTDIEYGENWPECARLLPHGLIVTHHSASLGIESARTALVLVRIGNYLRELPRLEEARIVGERAVELVNQFSEDELELKAVAYHFMSSVLRDLGDLQAAREFLEEAIILNEGIYGKNHPSLCVSLANYGNLLCEMRDLVSARRVQERGLIIAKSSFGPDDPLTIDMLASLALTLRDMGEWKEARSYMERALHFDETSFGPLHPRVARRARYLSEFHYALGEIPQAQRYAEKALEIDTQSLGPLHPTVATDLTFLGNVLRANGDLEGAREANQKALEIKIDLYGSDHRETVVNLNNLGNIFGDLGQYDASRTMLERSLAVDELNYGLHSLNLVPELVNLGGALIAANNPELAQQVYERALKILEQNNALDNPDYAPHVQALAFESRRQGNSIKAEQMLRTAISALEKAAGRSHPRLGEFHRSLAMVLQDQGKYTQARTHWNHAIAIHKRALGSKNLEVAFDLINLSTVKYLLGNKREWKTHFEEADSIMKFNIVTRRNDLTVSERRTLSLIFELMDRSVTVDGA